MSQQDLDQVSTLLRRLMDRTHDLKNDLQRELEAAM